MVAPIIAAGAKLAAGAALQFVFEKAANHFLAPETATPSRPFRVSADAKLG